MFELYNKLSHYISTIIRGINMNRIIFDVVNYE